MLSLTQRSWLLPMTTGAPMSLTVILLVDCGEEEPVDLALNNITREKNAMSLVLRNLFVFALGGFFCIAAFGQGEADPDQPPAILPLESETLPKLIAYPPLAEPLARGVVIIQYRTEHARIMPVFGKTAGDVSPRLGHLHVTVDDWKGTWAHTSEDPIILVGLTPGTHKVLLEVADPTHKILTSTTVSFIVPEKKSPNVPHMEEGHAVKP
ncbi:hypothetical protein QFZ85_001844 [Pseudomonas frederiksbergensis]